MNYSVSKKQPKKWIIKKNELFRIQETTKKIK